MCKGLDDNGTICDPSISEFVIKGKAPIRCGPGGPTRVYYFDHEKIKQGKFFFYIKSTSYVGKVTLNFATSPEKVGTDNHDQYFLIDNPYSFLVNRKETLYLLFPLKFLFSMESVSISQVNMHPIENVVQQIPFKDISDIKCDEFIKLYYYFTVNPCGIAK